MFLLFAKPTLTKVTYSGFIPLLHPVSTKVPFTNPPGVYSCRHLSVTLIHSTIRLLNQSQYICKASRPCFFYSSLSPTMIKSHLFRLHANGETLFEPTLLAVGSTHSVHLAIVRFPRAKPWMRHCVQVR